jgi:hypothetical protein
MARFKHESPQSGTRTVDIVQPVQVDEGSRTAVSFSSNVFHLEYRVCLYSLG